MLSENEKVEKGNKGTAKMIASTKVQMRDVYFDTCRHIQTRQLYSHIISRHFSLQVVVNM